MKMKSCREGVDDDGGRVPTVVVGVKLDAGSRELLTWALVKVARPGDRVIALHVLNSTELLDRDGKSSLLSLVKAFDSVLAVYEGFCNLKQVDLKLKICRGSSVPKVLVREASSFGASKVICGISRGSRTIGSSASIAKYCAKRLPVDCWVLAVNNGKVVFQREARHTNATANGSAGDGSRNSSILSAIHRTLRKNFKAPSRGTAEDPKNGKVNGVDDHHDSMVDSTGCLGLSCQDGSGCSCNALSGNTSCYYPRKNCSICAPSLEEAPSSNAQETDEANDYSLSLVPVETLEAASSSISLLIQELPELRPGWPFLHRTILPDKQASHRSTIKRISVVQWAMRLPSRTSAAAIHPDRNPMKTDEPKLDGESGAMVLVGNNDSPAPDPAYDDESKHIPKRD